MTYIAAFSGCSTSRNGIVAFRFLTQWLIAFSISQAALLLSNGPHFAVYTATAVSSSFWISVRLAGSSVNSGIGGFAVHWSASSGCTEHFSLKCGGHARRGSRTAPSTGGSLGGPPGPGAASALNWLAPRQGQYPKFLGNGAAADVSRVGRKLIGIVEHKVKH